MNVVFYNQSPNIGLNFNGNYEVSIKAARSVVGSNFRAPSDQRIKKEISYAENQTELSRLQKLRVAKYRHIDEYTRGKEFTNGFIAQELEQIVPEAVSHSSDFIPNVYELSAKTHLANSLMTITLFKNHEFSVGDEINLILPNGEKKAKVLDVPSNTSFTIDWDGDPMEKIFVYGKKVNDFHTVDYDRIFTLNVSATQELARRVEQLEAENAALRQRNDGLQQQNEGLRSDVSDIYKRLQSLEKRSHLEK